MAVKDPFGSHLLKTANQTKELGEAIAQTLSGGEIILAKAPMGAGKTCLAQGIAKGLGVQKVVNSPTFNMIKVYKGTRLTFFHVDAYRLENAQENRDIGLWDLLRDESGVVYIEWPEYIMEELKGIGRVMVVTLSINKDGSRNAEVTYADI